MQNEILPVECKNVFIGTDAVWEMVKTSENDATMVKRSAHLFPNEDLLSKKMLLYPCSLNPLVVLDSAPNATGHALTLKIEEKFLRYLKALYANAGSKNRQIRVLRGEVPRQNGGIDCGPMVLSSILKVVENASIIVYIKSFF
ncbi:uncharacterized protein LOC135685012 [Rhopilema esculentum]|uniref:uncharacterized protein LOC135685012 n=1 Tax=Rhopilema esculentum TaxID=499914 RepID=UPI0031E295C8